MKTRVEALSRERSKTTVNLRIEKLEPRQMLSGTTFNFDSPDFSSGTLNGQLDWVAESTWLVDTSSNLGSGSVSTSQNSEIATYNQPITLASPGETFSYSVNFQFGGGPYATPSAFVYTFLSGLKENASATSVGTGDTPADANIQIINATDNYRLLSDFTTIMGASNITGASLDAGDILQFDYTITLGADAASTSYQVRLQNLTDGTDTGTGTINGIDTSIYSALTGSGAYVFFQRINPGNGGTNLTDLQINSIMGDFVSGAPSADAGPDRIVILPDDGVTLDGSGADDGSITNYSWSQLSGPNAPTLSGETTEDLVVSGLVQGTYEFQLTVTDDELNTDSDIAVVNVVPTGGAGVVSGELKQWHKVTIDFQGPTTSETSATNPFTDYRLDVTFTGPSGQTFLVPGFYAADGDAGNSGASSGSTWRVHFAPDEVGNWTYSASFRIGIDVAIDSNPLAGTSAGFFDGATGAFPIAASDKAGDDFRAPEHGLIKSRGDHYLTFAGGDVFLKGGPNIPENFFGYDGFDNTPSAGHDFDQHVQDWNPGDPDWDDDDPDLLADDGRGIIGALNYIAEEGGNVIYFLPMNIGGDGQDTFPTIAEQNKTQYDVSKLAQWEFAMEHATEQGILLHLVLAETEFANENYHDNGTLGTERKLYYREMIARFGHHIGVEFNIGEENDYGSAKHQEFAAHLKSIDPYDHPVTTHTKGGQYDLYYDPLLGNDDFDITSFQGGSSRMTMASLIANWRIDSANAGVPWAISYDEPQKIENDKNDINNGYGHGRRDKMWPLYISGGAGFEWYVQQDGGGHSFDQQIDDFRAMDVALNWTGYARDFFTHLPLLDMAPDHGLGNSTAGDNTYVLAKPGDTYAMYNDRNGSGWTLDLSNTTGTFDVMWFDPRNGGVLQNGTVAAITGGGVVSLGSAPNSTGEDWAAVVTRQAPTGPNIAPWVSINEVSPVQASEEGIYEEQNGLVIMEMENTPSNLGLWNEETSYANYTGDGYLQFTGNGTASGPPNSPLEFRFRINQPGLYYLHLRSARDTTNGQPSDHSNDAYVRVDGDYNAGPNAGNNHGDDAPLSMLQSDTKFFGGAPDSFSWNSGNRLDPGGHNNKRVAVYDFKAGEEYNLVVSGRSKWFSVDRIVFRHVSVANGTAQNLSAPESSFTSQSDDLTFQLDGIVIDDGQVLTSPNLQWVLESGPGTASFTTPNNADTQVQFSMPGTYVVRLTADDGEFVTTATRTIVAPAVEAPSTGTSFAAIDDAYVEGTNGLNNTFIKVQPSGPARTGYLKFDVSGLNGQDISGARLRLSVSQDPGSGTLNLYEGSSNSWSEATVNSGNAPAQGNLIDSVSGTFSSGQIVEFDVSSVVSGNGTFTFVLEHGGGNDVWFSSKEGSSAPELIIDAGGAADFSLDGFVSGLDFLAWQRGNGLPNAMYHEGDGNGDGEANGADLAIWSENYENVSSAISADFQGNGIVDGMDFLILQRNFGIENAQHQDGDANLDEAVDHHDFSIWSIAYTASSLSTVGALQAANENESEPNLIAALAHSSATAPQSTTLFNSVKIIALPEMLIAQPDESPVKSLPDFPQIGRDAAFDQLAEPPSEADVDHLLSFAYDDAKELDQEDATANLDEAFESAF